MKLNPAGPRVLVKPVKLEDVDPVYMSARASGIAIPELQEKVREQQAVCKGVVVAIGNTCWQHPVGDGTPWCKVDDMVYYAKYAGHIPTDVRFKDYLILNDEDILGVIEND